MFIRNIGFVICLFLLAACKNSINGTDTILHLPPLSEISPEQGEAVGQQTTTISLRQLTPQALDQTWALFFQERGSARLWKKLQGTSKELYIALSQTDPIRLPNQVDELCAGIIQFLVCYHPTIEKLMLIGNPKNATQQLHNLPASISKLSHLKSLALTHNGLRELPAEIIQLQNLERLGLSENIFGEFPLSLCALKQLKVLSFSKNSLQQLPPTIKALTQLSKLNLADNLLDNLPYELGSLPKLQYLDIDANQLNLLPPNLARVTHLTAKNNPWINPDQCMQLTTNHFTNGIDAYHRKKIMAQLAKHPAFIGISAKNLNKQTRTLIPRIQAYEAMVDKRMIYFQAIHDTLVPFYWKQDPCSMQTIEEDINQTFSKHKIYLIPYNSQQTD